VLVPFRWVRDGTRSVFTGTSLRGAGRGLVVQGLVAIVLLLLRIANDGKLPVTPRTPRAPPV